jgi:RNA-directed DNA polymerase
MFQNIASYEKLFQAHKKCRLGKGENPEVIRFEMNLGYELTVLSKQLMDYTYRLGKYYQFEVHDPKKRVIHALRYRDRIVQHALCDEVLAPVLGKSLIYDNSACRTGKGTDFSRDRLTLFFQRYYQKNDRLTQKKGYLLKFDIRKYFDSMSHVVLKQQMSEKFSQEREILGLLYMIIQSFETTPGRGVPMGNQTSQWFGLYYLNGLDHFIKEELRIKYYTRYMDDGIMIHQSKEYLQECLEKMKEYIRQNLQIEFNEKTQIVPISQGVDYLGFHFYMTDTGKVIRRLRTSSKKRLKKKLRNYKRAYRTDKITLDAITRSLASYRGHLAHGHTYALKKNLLDQFILTKSKNNTKQDEKNHINSNQ